MNNDEQDQHHDNLAQVGISKTLLSQLLSMGLLHCDDCRCLNRVAKDVIWQTLLNNSVKWEC